MKGPVPEGVAERLTEKPGQSVVVPPVVTEALIGVTVTEVDDAGEAEQPPTVAVTLYDPLAEITEVVCVSLVDGEGAPVPVHV